MVLSSNHNPTNEVEKCTQSLVEDSIKGSIELHLINKLTHRIKTYLGFLREPKDVAKITTIYLVS